MTKFEICMIPDRWPAPVQSPYPAGKTARSAEMTGKQPLLCRKSLPTDNGLTAATNLAIPAGPGPDQVAYS